MIAVVTHIVDELTRVKSYSRGILLDKGNLFVLKNKHSKFGKKLRKRGIKNIKTAVYILQQLEKSERFFKNLAKRSKILCRQ